MIMIDFNFLNDSGYLDNLCNITNDTTRSIVKAYDTAKLRLLVEDFVDNFNKELDFRTEALDKIADEDIKASIEKDIERFKGKIKLIKDELDRQDNANKLVAVKIGTSQKSTIKETVARIMHDERNLRE